MFMGVPAHLGYPVLAALVAGESAGLPIPSETTLVSASLPVGAGGSSLPLVVAVAAAAAIVGDNIGFRRHRQHLLGIGGFLAAMRSRPPRSRAQAGSTSAVAG